MTSDDIKIGRYYRLMRSQTIWFILHIWEEQPGQPASAEVVVVREHGKQSNKTKVLPLSQIASYMQCEVKPTWKDVEVDEPDPRQTDVEEYAVTNSFMSGLLSDG